MHTFHITPKDIPEDIAWLCEIVGIDRLMEIIDTAGGEFLYLPKRQTIEQPLRRDAICREYDGSNTRLLARKYGLTERRVRTILREYRGEAVTG